MKYDQTLFSGTAEYYAKYRPKYPKQLFDKIIQTFASDHNDVLLDLGCGTGAISLPLAKYFGQALAWDPDADMLQQAQREAKRQNIENIIFEQKSSDDLPNIGTKIKLVTMGQSLHWMDGANTLAEIKKHLTDTGGIAITGVSCGIHVYNPEGFSESNALTVQRNQIIYETVAKFLGTERRAGKSTFKTSYQPYSEILKQAGFTSINEEKFDLLMPRSIESTLGYIYSTSWGNRKQLGIKALAFDQELTKKLQALAPDGIFQERVIFSLITANGSWRPASTMAELR